jgi:hypothetical protein
MSIGGGGGDQDGRWRHVSGGRPERVERPRAVRRGGGGSRWADPSQKTRGVKLNGTRVVDGEPTNRKKTMSDMWGYENVVEIERPRENQGTY